MGKPLVLFVARTDQPLFHSQLSYLKSHEQVQNWELQLQPWLQKPFPAGITIAVKQELPEQKCRLYWLIQDLTTRQQTEAERQRAEQFALLGKLAAGLSHEIRNPRAAITLNVDVLEEELTQPLSDSTAQVARSLAEIKVYLARVDDLPQDYLSLVRLSTLSCEPVDLGKVVTTLPALCDARAAGNPP